MNLNYYLQSELVRVQRTERTQEAGIMRALKQVRLSKRQDAKPSADRTSVLGTAKLNPAH